MSIARSSKIGRARRGVDLAFRRIYGSDRRLL